ncbi:hypothetical protein Pan97_02720 [Bremerella volcania]|uniref:Leucine Rich repeats (2 copies) n=1 Tax=Bremerella volcania TaxID=2527984 RepID=A0A518C260_9BACT|nr:hypothetical protein [Bremerella volcania]QDU73303.1 hypothetical protein Pan97_02720 [Bremerella volcania]
MSDPIGQSSETTQPKRRGFWRRLSLRMLLVLVALVAVLFGLVSHQMRVARLHADVANNLRAMSVDVASTRATHLYLGPIPIEITDQRQAMLDKFGANDLTYRIGRIVFREDMREEKLNKTINELRRLDSFFHLSSYGSEITQTELARLLEDTHVDTLYLEGMKVDRRGIPCLHGSEVRWLLLARTQFSDPGIDDLPDTLEHLDVTRTRITDQGLDKFVRLKNLKTLILRRTPASEEGIEALRQKMPWCRIAWEPLTNP